MNRRPGYSKEVRDRAVRLVLTSEHDHSSRWAATQSVASKIGCTPETLRSWVKKMEVDTGTQPGVKSDEFQRTKALEQALWARGKPTGVRHHSDRGSQYLSIRYTDRHR